MTKTFCDRCGKEVAKLKAENARLKADNDMLARMWSETPEEAMLRRKWESIANGCVDNPKCPCHAGEKGARVTDAGLLKRAGQILARAGERRVDAT